MSILGLDVGTTCVKCQIFDLRNRIISESHIEYDIKRDKGNHEIDMNALTCSLFEVIKKATERLDDKVEGICVSSLGESFVPVDEKGVVLRDSMLYSDRRGSEEVELLIETLGEQEIANICGAKPHAMYSLPKMMWIKKHQNEIYQKTKKFLSIGDYIYFLLTGLYFTDFSLATRTLAFDIKKCEWSDTMLKHSGIDKEKLPTPVPSGTVIGKVTEQNVEKLNLKKGCVVITGGHDQVCACIGAGVVDVGQCNDGTGTVECMSIMFDKIPSKQSFYDSGYAVVPYAIANTYITYAFTFTGGALLKWFRDKIAYLENGMLKEKNIDLYDYYCDKEVNLPTKILTLPYFVGSATPYMDANAQGVILGLNLETTSADIFHSLMEGTTYEMKTNLEILSKSGVEITECTATGGGARSKKWLQIKADVLDLPIYPLRSNEGGIEGCFILSCVALGYEKSIKSAVEKFIKRGTPYISNVTKTVEYEKQFERYKKLYPSLKEIF